MSLRYREGLKRKTVGNNLERLLFGYLETLWLYYALIIRTLTATVEMKYGTEEDLNSYFICALKGVFFCIFHFLNDIYKYKTKISSNHLALWQQDIFGLGHVCTTYIYSRLGVQIQRYPNLIFTVLSISYANIVSNYSKFDQRELNINALASGCSSLWLTTT